MKIQNQICSITEPPQIIPIDFGSQAFYEGDLAQVNCVLRKGDPPLTIKWLLNGVELVTTDAIQILSVGNRTSILTIDPVGAQHQGVYSCFAENDAGTAEVEAEMIVNGTQRNFIKLMDIGY